MDCTICLENNIKKENMEYLNCGHSICNICFDRLIKAFCPFCRNKIENKENKSFNLENNITISNINNINEDNDYQVDNILPQSELNIIYDRYGTYYPLVEETILRRLNKKKCKKKHCNIFRLNKDREFWERKTKKNKKRRDINYQS